MKALKAIGNFFAKVGKAIGRFFVRLGKGIGRFFKNLVISIKNWFVRFGRRFKDSSTPTKVGHFAMGVGNIAHKQYAKGILFLLIEIVFFVFMFSSPTVNDTPLGVKAIGNFFTLGDAHAMNTTNGTNSFVNDYEFVTGSYSAIIIKNGELDSSSEPVVASIVRTRQVFDKMNEGKISSEILENVSKAGNRKVDDIWWAYEDTVGKDGQVIIDKDYDKELPDIYCYQELNTSDPDLYFNKY